MEFNIFAINPGSTSTKGAFFRGRKCVFEKVIRHSADKLREFPTVANQFQYRMAAIRNMALEESVDLGSMNAFVGRGGLLRPLKGGTYIVDKPMLEDLDSARFGEHASNLGGIIASELASEYGKKAFVVNPVVVDEFMDESRLSGLPEITRKSAFHALNQKSAAMQAAAESGIEYQKGNFIVAHLGGGISVGAHLHGRVVDVNNALEEGPFSPERSGSLPVGQLLDLCFSGKYTKKEIKKMVVGKGGLFAYTGTTDCKKLIEESQTNTQIKKIIDAMIYQISKEICACSAALSGEIHRVVITGGLAYSNYISDGIKKRVSFLGPVSIYPGENEMAAMAEGAIRVLEGKEEPLIYGKGGC